MPILHQILRPATLSEAVALMEMHGDQAALLAGGADLIGALSSRARPEVEVVIDLGNLRLSGLHASDTHLTIGATATLTDILENETARALAGGLLRRTARSEGPLNYRNAATAGGIIAGAATDSAFYAALLALGANISTTASAHPKPLATLSKVEGIITAVHLPLTNARSGFACVARTPADRPIVAAVAVVADDATRVALCGMAHRPILEGIDAPPYADFRGSADYRQAMAAILRERALAQATTNHQ
jgi:CO/xanthine dehydrogenase FAD-binding subunit